MRRVFALVLVVGIASACSSKEEPAPKKSVLAWAPGTVYPTDQAAGPRGFLDRRGLIHAHSVYSHDACDGQPQDAGVINAPCMADFRHGVCATRHDFVMLTDHNTFFSEHGVPRRVALRRKQG